MIRRLTLAFLVLSSTAVFADEEVELTFRTHPERDRVEQHVYVERVPGSGEVYRTTPADHRRYLNSPLYAPSEVVPNAPFDHGAVGPYPIGRPLGTTLGDWISASGSGTYRCEDSEGMVAATFDGLVPNAVYTMWYAMAPVPPLDPFANLDMPLGARDGSQATFISDANGHAEYDAVFSPCLQFGGSQVRAGLAIVWHSDGQTYGSSPGPWSVVSHAQLGAGLPKEEPKRGFFATLRSPFADEEIELVFRTHLERDLVEQHVYVERVPGSGEVYRTTPADHHRYLNSPVYAPADGIPNAPFDHGAVGPYPIGRPLGITLGNWISASGSGSYRCEDGEGTVSATFDGLVPDAVYTMWYALLPVPPLDPFANLDMPLGARDGSQATFASDADGRAVYHAVFSPCLQFGGSQVRAMLAIVWHSDGQTYASSPGPWSVASHVHLGGAALPTE